MALACLLRQPSYYVSWLFRHIASVPASTKNPRDNETCWPARIYQLGTAGDYLLPSPTPSTPLAHSWPQGDFRKRSNVAVIKSYLKSMAESHAEWRGSPSYDCPYVRFTSEPLFSSSFEDDMLTALLRSCSSIWLFRKVKSLAKLHFSGTLTFIS